TIAVLTLAAACENCIYGKIVPPSGPSDLAGQRYCADTAYANAQIGVPTYTTLERPYAPNITPDDYWCGEGADVTTGISFSSTITQLPQQQLKGTISGAFTCAGGANSFAVSDSRVSAGLNTVLTATTTQTAAFVVLHGIFVSAISLSPAGF